MSEFDPKELKVLSDILALVLEDQPGQSAAALDALRARARRNGQTGGALKNLFVAVAREPARAATTPKPRTRRSTASTAAAKEAPAANEIQAARTRIAQLAADVNKMDLELRNASSRIDSLRQELQLTRQSRAELQQALQLAHRTTRPRNYLYVLVGLLGLTIGIACTMAVTLLDQRPVASDNLRYLR
jgi:hypothetical protein